MEEKQKKRVVIKVGTNVLTRKNKKLDHNRISDLVDQIAVLIKEKDCEVVFISSGAVGAGREYYSFQLESDTLVRRQMLASVGQARLFQVYSDFLREYDLFPAQLLYTRNDFFSKTAFENIKTILFGLLSYGVVPIVNENDVIDKKLRSFGDNDQLAALTASIIGADLLVILTDIEGLYDSDPKSNPNAKLIKEVHNITPELIESCSDTTSSGGTGGMLSKLKAAELATQHGIKTVITSGKENECILGVFNEKFEGTTFYPSRDSALALQGVWLNTGAEIQGHIYVDEGAEVAIKEGKSLLAVGIIKVSGQFDEGDPVDVFNDKKEKIGNGIVKVDSIFLSQKLREQDPQGVIVIHSNQLFMINKDT